MSHPPPSYDTYSHPGVGGSIPPGGAPTPLGPTREDGLMEQFRQLAARYEISDRFARKLKQLESFEIVLILDDSGSMNTPLAPSNGQIQSPFAKSTTRQGNRHADERKRREEKRRRRS